jgi:broad specificity phosphatase PhoE
VQVLYLIRHGESEWNRQSRIQGYLDSDLSELGRKQARRIGKRLARENIQQAVTSNATRAADTCWIAIKEFDKPVPVHETAGLREINLGVWEGVKASELRRKTPEAVELWLRRPSRVRIEGGERLSTFRTRVRKEMNRVLEAHNGKNLAVFTHGGVICSYLTSLLGMKLDDIWRFKIGNGSITKVIFPMEQARIEILGDVHHLEGVMRPLDQVSIPGLALLNSKNKKS